MVLFSLSHTCSQTGHWAEPPCLLNVGVTPFRPPILRGLVSCVVHLVSCIENNGNNKKNVQCPATGEELTADDLLELRSDKAVKPRPVEAASIPGLLAIMQVKKRRNI